MKLSILSHADICNILRSKGTKQSVNIPDLFDRVPLLRKIKLDVDGSKYGWHGDTKTLFLKRKQSVMVALHEASHYFLCPAHRLKYNDFGLGIGYGAKGLEPQKRTVNIDLAQLEEGANCLLSWSIAKAIGVRLSVIAQDIKDVEMNGILLEPCGKSYYMDLLRFLKTRWLEQHGFVLKYPN